MNSDNNIVNKQVTTVVNVKVAHIRPKYDNFREWCISKGLTETFIKEVPSMKPLNDYIKNGGDIPDGVKRDSNLSLRVNKGVSKGKDFEDAGKGILEQMGVFNKLNRISESSD